MRELTTQERQEVNGAILGNALGALLGGLSAGAGASLAGGSYRTIAAATVGGAITGAFNPFAAGANATRVAAYFAAGRIVVPGLAGGAASTAIGS